jgi:SAM-dependent methyltransferase
MEGLTRWSTANTSKSSDVLPEMTALDQSRLSPTVVRNLPYFDLHELLGRSAGAPGGNPVLDVLLDWLELDSSALVLDAGSNTGATTRRIVQRTGCRAIGIDIHDGLVRRARALNAAAAAAKRVHVQRGDAEALEFPSEFFDAVISTGAIGFIGQPERAAVEMGRVCASSGRVGLVHYHYARRAPAEVLASFATTVAPINALTFDQWCCLLRSAGLRLERAEHRDGPVWQLGRQEIEAQSWQEARRIFPDSPDHQAALAARYAEVAEIIAINGRYLGIGIYCFAPQR